MLLKKSKIFIFNPQGLIGQTLVRLLRKRQFKSLILSDQSQMDFTDQCLVNSFFKKVRPDYCFLTPIREGGILANIDYPAELIYQNLIIQANIMHAAWRIKVKKLLFFASSCVYPKDCPQPAKAQYLLSGPLEQTNEPYAVAKIAGIKMCQAYNRQYKTEFISVIPATVYGPYDNFDLNTAHVIPALIRKFHEAKVNRSLDVNVWGRGGSRREFIYVDDLAGACLFLLESNNSPEVVNIGSGEDVSVRELAETIKRIIGFKGNIIFDIAKPQGSRCKLLDSSLFRSLGWQPRIGMVSGLEKAYRWYLRNKS